MLNYYENPEKLCSFGKSENERLFCYKSKLQKKQNCSVERPLIIQYKNMKRHSRAGGLLKKFALDADYEYSRGDF